MPNHAATSIEDDSSPRERDDAAGSSPSGAPQSVVSSTDASFARVAESFEYLRQLVPAERRAALSRLIDDDPTLAGEVAELLRHHDGDDPLLDAPLIRPGVPGRIGPYRLVHLLGEGGMGTVWLAEQEEPVRRQVALKLIKLGMDSRQVLRRFQAERQVLARMEHPGIARMLDAGMTPEGRPYFVMELVRGDRLTSFADRHDMPLADRLRLFQQVCAAVQHAHGKGFIHRDLKPSNILVTEVDGDPVPKVIDFGVAKVLDDPRGGANRGDAPGSEPPSELAGEPTQWTRFGHAIGTPDYMSPEQAGATLAGRLGPDHAVGSAFTADVDIRSDVWSLGVVLFELLTGTTPTRARTRTSSGSATPSRSSVASAHVAAPRPSSVVAPRRSLAATPEQVERAARRSSEPAALRRVLRSELDWIALRALEPDPARRYGTVAALSDDISRFLEHRPIAARPSAGLYEARMFARRHVVALTAGSLTLLSIVIGLATALYGLDQARGERDTARAAENRASALAERLGAELAINRIERGRLAGYAGNVALASGLLWDAYLDDPGSRDARWALREMLMRHPIRMSVTYPGKVPYEGAMLGRDRLLVVGWGHPPVVLDVDTGAILQTLDGSASDMRSLDLSPDGTLAVTGGRDGVVRLWLLPQGSEAGRELAPLCTVREGLVAVRFLDHGRIIAGDADGTLHVVAVDESALQSAPQSAPQSVHQSVHQSARKEHPSDASSRGEVRQIPLGEHLGAGAIGQLDVHRPSGRVAVGGRDGSVLILDDLEALDGAPRRLGSHRGIVMALRFSPDGAMLASGATDQVVRLWDSESGSRVHTLEPLNGSIRDLRYSEDGRTLLVLGWWRLDRYDMQTFAAREVLAEGGWRLVPHADPDRVVIVGRNRVHVRSWQLDPQSLLARHSLPAGWSVRHLHSPCGSSAVGTRGSEAAGFDDRGGPRWRVHLGATGVMGVAVSPAGDRLAVGGDDGAVRLVELEPADDSGVRTGRIVRVVEGYLPGSHRALAFVDGDTLLMPAPGNAVVEVALGTDARRTLLNSVSTEQTAADAGEPSPGAFPASDGSSVPSAAIPPSRSTRREILMCAVSPDRRVLAVAQRGGLLHLIDRATGAVRTAELETANFSLAFTRDGRHLISGGWTGIVSIFDVATFTRRHSQGHTALVTNIATHPTDADLFASVSSDGTVRIWSVAECRNVYWHSPSTGPLANESGVAPLVAVGFDERGDVISTAALGGTVASWPLDLADPFIAANLAFERQQREQPWTETATGSDLLRSSSRAANEP